MNLSINLGRQDKGLRDENNCTTFLSDFLAATGNGSRILRDDHIPHGRIVGTFKTKHRSNRNIVNFMSVVTYDRAPCYKYERSYKY